MVVVGTLGVLLAAKTGVASKASIKAKPKKRFIQLSSTASRIVSVA
jgi:hypothetical protein